MGSSKKQTVGYHYKLLLFYGICRGPVDAFLEWRGGDRAAWRGSLTESSTINVNAPNLWGGEKSEGGVVGSADVMFGEADQAPNGYLASNLTPQQPGMRGKLAFLFKGGRFGINPYPKSIGFKLRRILKGWDNDEPWYPEKAEIPMALGDILQLGPTSTGWKYKIGAGLDDYIDPTFDDSEWSVGASPFASSTGHPYVAQGGYPNVVGTLWPTNTTIWVRRKFTIPNPFGFQLEIFVDNYATVWVNGHLVLPRQGSTSDPGDAAFRHAINVPAEVLLSGDNVIVLKAEDYGTYSYAAFKITSQTAGLLAMNPAHILFDSLTQQDMQGEPLDNVDEASFIAAADRLYDEGFGLCTEYDHARETSEQFQERIQNVIGAALTQSRLDGRYRLDLIRGDYDPETLPILTDADILEFSREPSNPNDSVNEVIVEWFDPERKEKRATTPLQSLGAIMAAGAVISETGKYPEIPVESLALRVAARDLKNKSSPTNRFGMTTTRVTYGWRSGTFFRLQAPRRGIADMVCMVGEISAGTLRSGAMTMTAVQDVSRMPDTTYVEIEPGVDTAPSQTPQIPAAQRVIEAPYVEIAGTLPNAELAALPADAGYLLAMAARPASGINYSLWTRADAEEFADQGVADWCPSATVDQAATIDPAEVEFTLSARRDLDRVEVGTAALWGDELVRVDALDADTGAVTFGRAVGDTVIQEHAAGERVWFFDAWAGTDQREYVAGEVAQAKMLTRTSTQELALVLAPASSVEMDQRAARPYPPAGLRINGEILPSAVIGSVALTWSHRDRLLQADQLVDDTEASIGPEPGTTYTVRYFLNGSLVETQVGIATDTTTYAPAGGGLLRIEVEAVRDGLPSWQMHVREITIGSPFLTEDDLLIVTEDDDPILME